MLYSDLRKCTISYKIINISQGKLCISTTTKEIISLPRCISKWQSKNRSWYYRCKIFALLHDHDVSTSGIQHAAFQITGIKFSHTIITLWKVLRKGTSIFNSPKEFSATHSYFNKIKQSDSPLCRFCGNEDKSLVIHSSH